MKKRELEPNWNRHFENDANQNRWFPLEPENRPTLVLTLTRVLIMFFEMPILFYFPYTH